MQIMDQITFGKALDYFGQSVGALIVADQDTDTYKALVRRGIFAEILEESGTYKSLIQKLWFHFNNSDKGITEDYQVFIPIFGKFTGKNSKRLKLLVNEVPHIVQMMIQPIEETDYNLIILDELDESACEDDTETLKKVNTIQNIYLFSMCFDLTHDTTSSISLTEVSEDTMNPEISYSDWRLMIANMFLEKDQPRFLRRSDPEYLRSHFEPGHIESFDIQMRNLDGVFIWVKLIFSRMATTNENDYRFVYMEDAIRDRGLPIPMLIHPAVQTLLEYDDEHEGELAQTLRVYLDCHCNATEAAERLFIHRTTLFRRLERIRALTGLDPNDSDEVLLLMLSFRLLN